MNKIYRLVWNKSLSLWTVVSENARGVTKKRNVVTNTSVKTVTSSSIQKYKQYQLKPSLIALTISSVFFTGNVFAATNTGGGAVSNNGSGNSMAISPTQSQCGSDGQASVNGNNGVAVGCGNSVGPVGSNSQGLVNRRGTGSNNYPTGPAGIVSSATAVGKNNKISNTGGASLFGTGNVSEGSGTFHNVGIGQGNLLGGPGYNTAIGIGNEAVTGASSVVIGTDNRSRGGTAIVMGRQSYADANYGISLGNTATVEEGATAGISVGHSALVSGVRGIAIGNSTASSNNQDTATAATASGTDAVAIGTTSNATANQTTAVGRRANAAGNNASAYGNQASAQGASSVAVGDSSNAQGDNDIAVGRNAATASGGSNNIAMGNGVTTGSTGQNVAIGSDGTTANSASADGGAVAIGRGQRARGDGAVAIGDPNTTNGNGAVAVGRNNTAAGDTAGNTAADGAVALGNENQAIGQGSVALGNASRAEQAGSIALGDTANAKAARGIALGSNAVANNADDVALGSGSTTSTASGAGFLTGIAAPTSVVSVGTAGNERRIQNLSDGAADTDAVNVRQLKSLKDIVDEQGDTTAASLGGGSTYDPDTGTVTNPTYNVNGKDVNNVGAAITELDKGWNLQSNGANTGAVKAGDTVDIGTADGEENLQVAKDGNDIKYSLNRDLKVDSVKAGDTVINNDGMTIANGPSVTKSGIDAAGNTISNVADGVAGSDAVNKNQLDNAAAAKTEVTEGKNITVTKTTGDDGQDIYNVATADDVEFNSVKAGDTVINNDGMTIAGGPSITKDGIDAGNKTIGNVADGVADSDAVNKGQLDKSSQDLTDKGFGLTAQDGTTVQKKLGEAVEVVGADSNITTKVEDGKVAIELAKDLDVNSVKAGDTVINNDGMSIANGPSITKSGIDAAGNTISNVGPGVAGTDAVNKNQLDNAAAAAKTEVTEGKNITVTKTTGDDGQDIYNVATADDVEFNNVKVGDVTIDGTTGKISGVAAGDVNPDSTDAINGSQLANNAQSVADALGGGSTVNPDGTVSNPTYNINGTDTNNVGDALAELDKGWTLQSNGASAAAVKAGDTVDIGTADGEENLQVAKEGNDIKYSLNRDLKVDSVTAGDTVINNDGMSIANGPSVTKSGIDAAGNTISNVGPGVAGTDAVNKDQLDNAAAAAKTEVTQGKNITVTKTTGDDGQDIYNVATADDVEFNNVKVGDVTIDGTTGKISGVAAGDVNPDSTDAINGSQLYAQGEGVKNIIGGNTTYDPATGQYTNPDIGGTGQDNINDAIGAVGDAAKAAKTTVKEGENIVVTESKNADGSTNYEVATAKDVKFDSVTATDDEGNETVLTATGTQVKDGEGNEAEYGAKGISLKDQDGNGTILNSGGLGFVDPMGNNIGPSITVKGIDAGNTVITGVAAGRVAADSQDAINGSQLHGVSDSVKNIIGGNTTVNPDGTLSGSNIGGTGKDNINDAIGAVGDAAKAAKSTVSNKDGNISVNETTKPDGSRDYEVGLAKDIKVDSVTAGGTKVDGDGLHIDGGPSVTKDGIDAGDKKVTGVADGEVAKDSKDAVNGGQLHDVADSVKNVVGGNTTVNPDGTISTSNVGGTGHNNINDAIASVKQDAQAAKSTVSNKDGNINVNETTKADGSKDYEVGLADKIKVKEVDAGQVNVTGDKGSTTITGGGISITGPKGEVGPSMTTDGINAGGKKVTGVADGTIASGSKDAINGGQLHQSYQDVGAALGGGAGYDPEKGWKGPTYNVAGSNYNNVGDALGALNQADQALDNRITNLGDQMQQAFYDTNRRIDDVEKKANAGVAAAIALEAAPFVAGKYTYAVGAAYHGGENAFGATLRKTADNGRWSLTGGVAAASQGDPSFRLGLSGVID
ncbi:ESPR-type extended signal peptide-containing protein [Acinetobacter dispersus]|uniref:ESPR-type extended signal peptide-containing protein n=1 Tax=Acinetobacter dispersus TaxID=70348 RepID=UPI001F4A25B9|nr:ESPR-type extended signal peptide-containing protein [Acinetobacter dispersus]MCH7392283.1 hypothetical protein [Acinetobacter dispersus]